MPGKPSKKEPQSTGNIFHDLANQLSQVTGRVDKAGKIIMPPAEVLVAGSDDGDPLIKIPGVFSTRCETLDAAIGIGGIPMSRLTVITGGEGCGKTTICGHLVCSCQEMDGIPIYLDNEFKLDLDYFKALGVDLSRLLLSSPATVEDSFTILNEALLEVMRKHPGRPILGVMDSLNATKSDAEYEPDGTSNFNKANQGGLGSSARFMSTNLPKLLRLIHRKPIALVFICQPRSNIGAPGLDLITGGGNAPKFYTALAISLKKRFKPTPWWEESGRKIGQYIVASCFKNQVQKPYSDAEIPMRWGIGVDYNKSLLDQAIKMGLLNCNQGHYEMPTDDPDRPLKWTGLRGWHKLSTDRPDVYEYVRDSVRAPYAKYATSQPGV